MEPAAGGLVEAEEAPSEGRNNFGTMGYRGPCPPRGHGPHRYVFRLHALNAGLALSAGADRPELERALEGHVLDTAELVGRYERR
jgi:Raf kinase inhibitor-like YbhB/YbcL family protein